MRLFLEIPEGISHQPSPLEQIVLALTPSRYFVDRGVLRVKRWPLPWPRRLRNTLYSINTWVLPE